MALVPYVPTVEVPEHPPAPDGLDEQDVQYWEEVWASPAANVIVWPMARGPLERLFRIYTETRTLELEAHTAPLVKGSQGQLVLNPVWKQITANRKEQKDLEAMFGLNPRAGLTLGLQIRAAQRSLADMSREASEHASRRPHKAQKTPRRVAR